MSGVIICHQLSSTVILYVHSEFAAQISIEMPFDIKAVESPTHKIKMKVQVDSRHRLCEGQYQTTWLDCLFRFVCLFQRTSAKAVVELPKGSLLGDGFQLLIGLAEIHVPRMWVEEDDKGHSVSYQHLRLHSRNHKCCNSDAKFIQL